MSRDVPLVLRRRADGRTVFATRDRRTATAAIPVEDVVPATHEFSVRWLLEHTGSGEVTMDAERIVLDFANGRAVYRVDRERPSSGFWGVLETAELRDPEA